MFEFFSNILNWSSEPLLADTGAQSDAPQEPIVMEQPAGNSTVGNSSYHITVQIKNTGGENGPGHASVTTCQRVDGKTVESTHTSFTVAGPVGSLVNGATLGSVPVAGKICSDPAEDNRDASDILEIEVSESAYKSATQTQKELNEDIEHGRCLYSVMGTSNPLASVTVSAMQNISTASENTRQNAYVDSEDLCGIVVESSVKAEAATTPEKPAIMNCVSATTTVLAAANINTNQVFYPTGFTEVLEKQGFMRVKKSDDTDAAVTQPLASGI